MQFQARANFFTASQDKLQRIICFFRTYEKQILRRRLSG